MKSVLKEYPLNQIKLSKDDCIKLHEIISKKTDFESKEGKIGYLHELAVDKFKDQSNYLKNWDVKSNNSYDGRRDRLDGTSIKTNTSRTLEDDPDRHTLSSIAWTGENSHQLLHDKTCKQFQNNPVIEFHTLSQNSRKIYTDIINSIFEDVNIEFKFISTSNSIMLDYLKLGKENLFIHHLLHGDGKRLISVVNYEFLYQNKDKMNSVKTPKSFKIKVPGRFNLTTRAKDPQPIQLLIPQDERKNIARFFGLQDKALTSFLNNDKIRPSLKHHPKISEEIIKFAGSQKIGTLNFIAECEIFVDKAGRSFLTKDVCSLCKDPNFIVEPVIAPVVQKPTPTISNLSSLDKLISLLEAGKITDKIFNLALTKI